MLVLFLVTFVNLLGFGLLTPLLPFYVERVGGGPELITLIIAVYSGVQFLTGPTIGRLSDKFGRKPVLAWTTAGAAISHVLLGMADSLWLVIVARIIGGIAAANIGVAFAYVADVSSGAERAKSMGILGSAFSFGFMFGPAMGGVMAGPDLETANFMLPAFSAAGMAIIATFSVIVFLPESLKPEERSSATGTDQIPLMTQVRTTFSHTTMINLSLMAFLVYVSWSTLLSILTLWINRVLELGPRDIGLIFLYSGFIGAVCQLVLIGPITKRIGENAVVMWSIAGMGLGLAVLAMTASVTMTLLAMTLVSAAHSFFSPVSTAVVSHFAKPAERGMVLGVFQGIGSLGRVAGPAFAGVAFAQISYSSPYWISALLTLPALVLAVGIMRRAQPG